MTETKKTNKPNRETPLKTSKVAFIQADWHSEILDQGHQTFVKSMQELGMPTTNIDFYQVSGALELPLQVKALAHSGRHNAFVASALIVDGGIYRHDFVADTVMHGLMQIQLEMIIPVLSMVLIPHHYHEHGDHQRFFSEHFQIKGREAAIACVKTLENLEKIRRNL